MTEEKIKKVEKKVIELTEKIGLKRLLGVLRPKLEEEKIAEENIKIVSSSPGKLIICGEHFGQAVAITAGIERRCEVTLIPRVGEPKIIINSDRFGQFEYRPQEGAEVSDPIFRPFIEIYLKYYRNRPLRKSLTFEIKSDIPKGLGSSSAVGSAYISALAMYFNEKIEKDEIALRVQEFDELAHGKASGMDSLGVVFGGINAFSKKTAKKMKESGRIKPLYTRKSLSLPLDTVLILVDSYKGGKRATTKEANDKFDKEVREKGLYPEYYRRYIRAYFKIRENLNPDGDPKKLGEGLNENHELLKSVTTDNIEKIREIALAHGAFGSKITGAGGEGSAVIVLANRTNKDAIIKALEEEGYRAFEVEFAKEGVKTEIIKEY